MSPRTVSLVLDFRYSAIITVPSSKYKMSLPNRLTSTNLAGTEEGCGTFGRLIRRKAYGSSISYSQPTDKGKGTVYVPIILITHVMKWPMRLRSGGDCVALSFRVFFVFIKVQSGLEVQPLGDTTYYLSSEGASNSGAKLWRPDGHKVSQSRLHCGLCGCSTVLHCEKAAPSN